LLHFVDRRSRKFVGLITTIDPTTFYRSFIDDSFTPAMFYISRENIVWNISERVRYCRVPWLRDAPSFNNGYCLLSVVITTSPIIFLPPAAARTFVCSVNTILSPSQTRAFVKRLRFFARQQSRRRVLFSASSYSITFSRRRWWVRFNRCYISSSDVFVNSSDCLWQLIGRHLCRSFFDYSVNFTLLLYSGDVLHLLVQSVEQGRRLWLLRIRLLYPFVYNGDHRIFVYLWPDVD